MNDMKTVRQALEERFDKIYCLNLSHRKDRRDKMIEQFKALDILDLVEFHISTTHPHAELLANAITRANLGSFRYGGEFNCAREHYSIVKKSYDLGMKSILVFEDDIMFLKNLDRFVEILEDIPEDYSCLQFGAFSSFPEVRTQKDINNSWMESFRSWNCSMYALKRRGMVYYMRSQEEFYTVADNPLYMGFQNKDIVKTYLCKEPVVIQELTTNESDIRPDQDITRDIKINEYEKGINRSNYGLFDAR